jgi:hypothetical protein
MSEAANATSSEALRANLEVALVGLAKSGLNTDLNSGRSTGVEVQRQFNVQSQFASLHRLYSGSFVTSADTAAPDAKPAADLSEALEALQATRRAVRADDLRRGVLTELRVALRAHPMFDVAVFIKAAGGLIQRHPELLPVPDPRAIQQMMKLGDLLNELMEDLVPIEGLSATYQVVEDRVGDRWIADARALKAAYPGEVVTAPLRVVGIAELGGFWKDTRRILHSNAEFDVQGRVSRSGLQTEWSPVKLADAFDSVIPGLGKSLIEALNDLKQIANVSTSTTSQSAALMLVALKLHEDLALHHGVEPSPVPEPMIQSLLTFDGGLEDQLVVLNQVTEGFYAQRPSLPRDAEVVASLRQVAWRSVKSISSLPDQIKEDSLEPDPLALEVEFVAMYW